MLGERDRAPLAQAAGTGDGCAVAVLREQRLDCIAARQIAADHVVHNGRNVLENVAPGDKGLVIARGIGDVEVVALRAVPLGETRCG